MEPVSMPDSDVSYVTMRSLGGLSDQAWSLIVQLAGIGASLGVGFFRRSRKAIWIALAIGLVANIVGQVLIAGGGGGAFVGMFILPAYCGLAALLGWGIGRVSLGAPPTRDDRR